MSIRHPRAVPWMRYQSFRRGFVLLLLGRSAIQSAIIYMTQLWSYLSYASSPRIPLPYRSPDEGGRTAETLAYRVIKSCYQPWSPAKKLYHNRDIDSFPLHTSASKHCQHFYNFKISKRV
ncbi:unnamed protein product [Cylicocyclus nassatus]|uniref:Uncharacterized protein n=1 Tax=Cylicocyclus nassatus TaxID=53992 RepID=A0AA36GLT4_CYLNA|nr:unnamed protein product [Cylicocyclus nassatus]